MKENQNKNNRKEVNKEIKYKLVVHDHHDSVVHRKTVKRNNRKETTEKKQKEREREIFERFF